MADKRALVFDPTEYFPDELTSSDRLRMPGGAIIEGAALEMSTQKITGLGAASAANDALAYGQSSASLDGLDLNSQKLTGVADGTVNTDGVNYGQLIAVAGGFDAKESVRMKTSSSEDLSGWTGSGTGIGHTLTSPDNLVANNDFDGITAVVGNRVLVTTAGSTAEIADVENGIYTVTQLATGAAPTILTRATDNDEDAEMSSGNCTFVSEGTANAGQNWCLVTADAITVDTTANQWSQISAIPDITFGAGLDETSGTASVELDASADAQGAGNGGGTSGLEFDVAGDGGKLRVSVSATGGINRLADGIGIEIDDSPDTLDVGAAGLKVVGLPSLFKVNDVAVGAAVTAANLDTLTDGSNADALHTHTGLAVDEAERLEKVLTTSAAVAAGNPVRVSGNDTVAEADAATPSSNARVIGVPTSTDGVGGGTVDVVCAGLAAGVLSGATANAAYYLDDGGGLTTTVPTGGKRVIRVGYAMNATDLMVQIMDFGRRA